MENTRIWELWDDLNKGISTTLMMEIGGGI